MIDVHQLYWWRPQFFVVVSWGEGGADKNLLGVGWGDVFLE